MTVDLDAILKAAGQLGIFVVAAGALWWALLIPRKDSKGNRRSPLLVPGSEHDRAIDECRTSEDRTRKFYEGQLTQERRNSEVRVGEVRGYRDEAIATNATLLETLTNATRDMADISAKLAVVLQILELADRDSGQSETKSG